jgi:hypothetical protein
VVLCAWGIGGRLTGGGESQRPADGRKEEEAAMEERARASGEGNRRWDEWKEGERPGGGLPYPQPR